VVVVVVLGPVVWRTVVHVVFQFPEEPRALCRCNPLQVAVQLGHAPVDARMGLHGDAIRVRIRADGALIGPRPGAICKAIRNNTQWN